MGFKEKIRVMFLNCNRINNSVSILSKNDRKGIVDVKIMETMDIHNKLKIEREEACATIFNENIMILIFFCMMTARKNQIECFQNYFQP